MHFFFKITIIGIEQVASRISKHGKLQWYEITESVKNINTFIENWLIFLHNSSNLFEFIVQFKRYVEIMVLDSNYAQRHFLNALVSHEEHDMYAILNVWLHIGYSKV